MPVTNESSNELEIRAIIEGWVQAVRAKDSRAMTSSFAPNAVLFDLIPPLQSAGGEAGRKRAAEWLGSFKGPLNYETRDLTIAASNDVAFCHSLNHVQGTTHTEMEIDMWWRATVCFRRIDGHWMVVHEHSSVPFDMNSSMGRLDLKP